MKRDDLSRSLVAFDQASSLVAVVELSLGSWLAAGLVPHLSRQPLKKLRADPDALLGLLWRWRDQATKAGGRIKRIVVAFEAGRDGFWLARWLRVRGSRPMWRAPRLARHNRTLEKFDAKRLFERQCAEKRMARNKQIREATREFYNRPRPPALRRKFKNK